MLKRLNAYGRENGVQQEFCVRLLLLSGHGNHDGAYVQGAMAEKCASSFYLQL
jgi:hypothetical protein